LDILETLIITVYWNWRDVWRQRFENRTQ